MKPSHDHHFKSICISQHEPLTDITLEKCDCICLWKCDKKRSDLSAQFSDLDQGSPDTKLKTYVASAALMSLTVFCFSDLRNNKCTTVDRCLTPLLHLWISLANLYCNRTTFILDRYFTKSHGSARGLFQSQSSST